MEAVVTTFPMNFVSGNQYSGTFTNIPVQVGDVVEYRIKAVDNSSQNNIAYSPSSGYNSFSIINTKGIVLVVDDDVTLANRMSSNKGFQQDVEKLAPLGASASLFNTTLTDRGYLVDEVTFGNLDVSTLPNYDIVILAAGVNTSTQFNDGTKRTALVNYVINGGKTLVEGGEVGYIYQAGASEVDALFRRTILNDSDWVSDVTSSNLVVSTPGHPIFNTPNSLTGPFNITATGYGPRDEMTLIPGKIGVTRIANWSSGSPNNPGIIVYNPDADPNSCDNIFFTFAISQFTDQAAAANLIENAVDYLMQDILPVRIIHTALTNTTNLDGPYVVNAEVTALNTLDPSSVKVFWGMGVGSITDSLLMTNSGGNSFTASIPGNGAVNIYNYYLKASDNSGNTASAPIGAPGDYYSFEAVVDIDAPTITHSPLSDQALGRWPIDISATVFDEFGVQLVQCEFNVNGGTATTFAMPFVSENNYRGTFTNIPVQVGDLIQYRIIATDNASNIAYSPASDYNSFNIINVKGNILVVDDDVIFEQRISADKNGDPDLLSPLGASASIFQFCLIKRRIFVEEVTFGNLDVSTLSDYDIVIFSAGVKTETPI